jgi:hypothetical protein
VEGGQPRDGGHARAGGGGRPGFATAVTTTDAEGDAVVEAKRVMAVEQHPPSLTSRRNQSQRRSSLDGGPLLRQPNDGGHGSRRGDGLLPAQRQREYRQGLDLGLMGLGLGSTIFFIFKNPFFVSVGNDRYYKPFIFCIIQIISVARTNTKYMFPIHTTNSFCSSV